MQSDYYREIIWLRHFLIENQSWQFIGKYNSSYNKNQSIKTRKIPCRNLTSVNKIVINAFLSHSYIQFCCYYCCWCCCSSVLFKHHCHENHKINRRSNEKNIFYFLSFFIYMHKYENLIGLRNAVTMHEKLLIQNKSIAAYFRCKHKKWTILSREKMYNNFWYFFMCKHHQQIYFIIIPFLLKMQANNNSKRNRKMKKKNVVCVNECEMKRADNSNVGHSINTFDKTSIAQDEFIRIYIVKLSRFWWNEFSVKRFTWFYFIFVIDNGSQSHQQNE